MNEEEAMEALASFAKKLIESQVDLPEEFQKVLDEHWWELVADESQI